MKVKEESEKAVLKLNIRLGPPKFFQSGSSLSAPYQDLLLTDSLCRRLLSCLIGVEQDTYVSSVQAWDLALRDL